MRSEWIPGRILLCGLCDFGKVPGWVLLYGFCDLVMCDLDGLLAGFLCMGCMIWMGIWLGSFVWVV